MKILLINGSPHRRGCVYTALEEIAKTLEGENIDTEILQIGREPDVSPAITASPMDGACRIRTR